MAVTRSTLRTCFTLILSAGMAASWTLQGIAAQSVDSDTMRATEYAMQLDRSLMAIEDGRRQAARDRWDPQYVVDTVGVDPAALYAFVHDNVGWAPYFGKLRGPVGVLMDRTGNSLDQSLLLAAMLTLAGQQVRLAHATLDVATVEAVWADFERNAALADAATLDASSVMPAPDDAATGRDAGSLPSGVSPETVESITPEAAPGARALPPASTGDAVLAQAAAPDPAGSGSMFGETMGGSGSMFEAVTKGGAEAPPATSDEAAELYELDKAAAEQQLRDAAASRLTDAAELDRRTLDQGLRLLSMFSPAKDDTQQAYELARAKQALADHWWVQVEQNGAWADYDVLALEGAPGGALAAAAETLAPDAVPADQTHRVALRVVAEQLLNGKLQEGLVFEHEFNPSELIGKRVSLRHLPMLWPSDWAAVTPDDVQEKLFAALFTQREWMPALTVGDEAFQQSSILDSGAVNPNPQPQSNPFLQIAFPAAGKVGRVADLFDQLLDESATPDDIATAEEPGDAPRANGELTAEWLEYTIIVPGEEPKTVRREIFDIVGPALRRSGDLSEFRMDEDKQLARAGGQMTETELVILPCWPASSFLADITAGLALANKPLLEEFTRDPFGKAPPNSVELFSKMSGVSGPAYLYASLRAEADLTTDRVFVDRPQVIAQHGVLTRVGPGEMTAKAALDIIENGVGVDPFAPDAFNVRVLQGVADTNAEALALANGGAVDEENVGVAFDLAAAEPEWTVFFPGDKDLIATLGLSPDMTARLLADLEAGQVIVSPSGTAKPFELAGWWRIDPATGTTLGMGNRGWGSVLVEYAFYLTIQAMLAQISCMAYTAVAEEKISSLTAEQGREKVRTWARNCVSQALLQTISGLSTSWITSRFLDGAKVPTWNDKRRRTDPTFPRGPNTPRGPNANNGPRPGNNTPRTGNNGPRTGGNNASGSGNGSGGGGGNGSGSGNGGGNGPNGPRPDPFQTTKKDIIPTDDKKRRPPPEDRRLDPPCRADAGFVRFASLATNLLPIRSDAEMPLLQLAAGAGCGPKPPPPPRNDAELNKRMDPYTKAHIDAHNREVEAARNLQNNRDSPAAKQAYAEAAEAARRARAAEMDAWIKNGGIHKGDPLPPGMKTNADNPVPVGPRPRPPAPRPAAGNPPEGSPARDAIPTQDASAQPGNSPQGPRPAPPPAIPRSPDNTPAKVFPRPDIDPKTIPNRPSEAPTQVIPRPDQAPTIPNKPPSPSNAPTQVIPRPDQAPTIPNGPRAPDTIPAPRPAEPAQVNYDDDLPLGQPPSRGVPAPGPVPSPPRPIPANYDDEVPLGYPGPNGNNTLAMGLGSLAGTIKKGP